MSAAIASAPAALHIDRDPSPKSSYQPIAPSVPHNDRASVSMPPSNADAATSTPPHPTASAAITSTRAGPTPKIVVKQEPGTAEPAMQASSRHRPRKLDLSIPSTSASMSTRPATAGIGSMQEVGLACLSPGFQTQDPAMREQLQRSITVRDQQRSIIEARLLKSARPSDAADACAKQTLVDVHANPFTGGAKTAGLSKKRPPPGLSIVPPSADQFANERIIQSAPLNQTFTGRHQPQPLTRHVANQPTTLASTSHIHHVPATQTNNRLPPLSDVFGCDSLNPRRDPNRSSIYSNSTAASHSNARASFPSPGFPAPPPPHVQQQQQQQQQQQPLSARPREYRSAEEAVHELSGGRDDLLPKIVHYPGRVPHTPPSPHTSSASVQPQPQPQVQVQVQPTITTQYATDINRSGGSFGGRRRTRAEYEGSSPPLPSGPEARRAPYAFGEGRDSPETQRRKKEEFLSLCARAWDLFHS